MLLFSQYSDISVLYVFHFSYKENLCLFHCWIICKCVFNFAISRPDVFWTIKTRPHHSCKLLKSLIMPHNCHIFLQATYWDRFLWRPLLGSSQCLCAPGSAEIRRQEFSLIFNQCIADKHPLSCPMTLHNHHAESLKKKQYFLFLFPPSLTFPTRCSETRHDAVIGFCMSLSYL